MSDHSDQSDLSDLSDTSDPSDTTDMSDLGSYMDEYWAVIHISEMTDCIPVVFPPKTVRIAILLYFIHL